MKSRHTAIEELSWIIYDHTEASNLTSHKAAESIWAYFVYCQEEGIKLEVDLHNRKPTK